MKKRRHHLWTAAGCVIDEAIVDHAGPWFFAFLESVDPVRSEGPLEGPAGALHTRPAGGGGDDWVALRFSAIDAQAFDERTREFDDLDPGRAAELPQRSRRRQQLQGLFESVRLPAIHMDSRRQMWGEAWDMLVPGRWFVLAATPIPRLDAEPYILVADSEAGDDDAPWSLLALLSADERLVRRLRNVFSLAHIGDLGEGGDDDGGTEPLTPAPEGGLDLVIEADDAERSEDLEAHVTDYWAQTEDRGRTSQRPAEIRLIAGLE